MAVINPAHVNPPEETTPEEAERHKQERARNEADFREQGGSPVPDAGAALDTPARLPPD